MPFVKKEDYQAKERRLEALTSEVKTLREKNNKLHIVNMEISDEGTLVSLAELEKANSKIAELKLDLKACRDTANLRKSEHSKLSKKHAELVLKYTELTETISTFVWESRLKRVSLALKGQVSLMKYFDPVA